MKELSLKIKIIKDRAPYKTGEEYEVRQSPYTMYWRIVSDGPRIGCDIPKNITDRRR